MEVLRLLVVEVLRLLVERGAAVNHTDGRGGTAAMDAASEGQVAAGCGTNILLGQSGEVQHLGATYLAMNIFPAPAVAPLLAAAPATGTLEHGGYCSATNVGRVAVLHVVGESTALVRAETDECASGGGSTTRGGDTG